MALDFEMLRKKLSTLQGQNNRSNAVWKPSAGKTIVRIVPWKDRPELPFIELYFHYIGNKTYLSPQTHGNPDPLVEFADKLRSTGDRDDWSHARQFMPKLRTYVPVVVRGEEEQGVRFWGFGKTVYEQLLETISDPDWGDITDPQSGRDIVVNYTPQKESDTNFAKTSINVKPTQTPLFDDAEEVEKALEKQPDIYEVFPEPSYDELASFLTRYLNPDQDPSVTAAAEEDSEEESTTDTTTSDETEEEVPAPKKPKSKKVTSTDQAKEEFAKLFNDS